MHTSRFLWKDGGSRFIFDAIMQHRKCRERELGFAPAPVESTSVSRCALIVVMYRRVDIGEVGQCGAPGAKRIEIEQDERKHCRCGCSSIHNGEAKSDIRRVGK